MEAVKQLRFLPPALLVLQLILPLCSLLAFLTGTEFTIYNESLYVILCFALMLVGVVVLFIWNVPHNIIYLLLVPATLINSALMTGCMVAVYLAPLNAVAAIALLLRRGEKWKIWVSLLCILPALALGWWGAVRYVFDIWGENTLIQELPSPDGGYTARVFQHSFDGDAMITVQDTFRVNILIGEFTIPARHIYFSPSDPRSLQIQWQDDDTLLVNGETYHVEELP